MTSFKQLIENTLNNTINEDDEGRYHVTGRIHHTYNDYGMDKFKEFAGEHNIKVHPSRISHHDFFQLEGNSKGIEKVLKHHYDNEFKLHTDTRRKSSY